MEVCRYTNNIKFVRQAIDDTKINTTSLYVEHIPDEKWKQHMKNISSSKNLVIDLIIEN